MLAPARDKSDCSRKIRKVMKNFKYYFIPSAVSIILFVIIIKPGFFNIIPYFIHQSIGLQDLISEQVFIYLFDIIICILVWIIVFKQYKNYSK
ncbi:hypothetical protein ATB97_17690 [Elizabethkingia bruuniana]|nr:hypothetical protein AYC65_13095 [Elizabethkingia bruuniana]KUY27536.1 hypothetical protein ATB97_17690 [Elizabethkingia bruuniana]OPB63741.1 hypothetical protein BAY12_10155 [Elizabethkingia bruuniana]